MTRKEYLIQLQGVTFDSKAVRQAENAYGFSLPTVVKQMLSFSKESIFFDDEWRTLSLAEVLDAQDDLHVDFKASGLLPLIDCGENDFIVYHAGDNSWSKYNIVDEVAFDRKTRFEELLG